MTKWKIGKRHNKWYVWVRGDYSGAWILWEKEQPDIEGAFKWVKKWGTLWSDLKPASLRE